MCSRVFWQLLDLVSWMFRRDVFFRVWVLCLCCMRSSFIFCCKIRIVHVQCWIQWRWLILSPVRYWRIQEHDWLFCMFAMSKWSNNSEYRQQLLECMCLSRRIHGSGGRWIMLEMCKRSICSGRIIGMPNLWSWILLGTWSISLHWVCRREHHLQQHNRQDSCNRLCVQCRICRRTWGAMHSMWSRDVFIDRWSSDMSIMCCRIVLGIWSLLLHWVWCWEQHTLHWIHRSNRLCVQQGVFWSARRSMHRMWSRDVFISSWSSDMSIMCCGILFHSRSLLLRWVWCWEQHNLHCINRSN
jgi:hypothetical protein